MRTEISAQIAVKNILRESLLVSQESNPSYSIRAFARKLALNHSALSEIMNGKRAVSKKMALRLVEKLELKPKEAKALLALFPVRKGETPNTSSAYLQLSDDQYHLLSDWYYYAILSLVETEDFKLNAKWISKRLNIKFNESQIALKRLLRLKMIIKDAQGKFVRGQSNYTTPDDQVKNIFLNQAHLKNLELVRYSLANDTLGARDITSLTMPIDPAKIPVAKKLIREFQDKLALYLETSPKTEVYRLCMQLVPLTRREINYDS